MKGLTPYRRADHETWPVHVVYDELREEQIEGFIHPLGLVRKSRRAILATARQRARREREPQDRTHQRGTQAGRLLTREERGLDKED